MALSLQMTQSAETSPPRQWIVRVRQEMAGRNGHINICNLIFRRDDAQRRTHQSHILSRF